MFSRKILVVGGILAAAFGVGIASWISFAHTDAGGAEAGRVVTRPNGKEEHGPAAGESLRLVKLTSEQIAASKVAVSPVSSGIITERLIVPGVITMDAERVARIAANVVGIVAELRKKLGDPVQKNEAIAVLESREVADARSEYLTALVDFQLQGTLFERDRTLWQKQFTPEQQYLRTRSSFAEARVRVEVARQKLLALNLDMREIDETLGKQASAAVEAKDATALPEGTGKSLRRYELRAPIAGRVVERRVDAGAPVGKEGQEAEIYVIADLSSVWVELSVPAADLEKVKEGQPVTVKGSSSPRKASGKIIFTSPMLNNETRSARVIAAIDNSDFAWRPGTFIAAEITVDERSAGKAIPAAAIQKFNGENAVFVRTADGFERREVSLGQQDGERAEVISGLNAGEQIAISNTFILKAELGKAAAQDAD